MIQNFCNGEHCSKCGACCTNYLYLTTKEIKDIKRYINKHKIKDNFESVRDKQIVLMCPFVSNEGCLIYEHRPEICKKFQCNMDKSLMEYNKKYFFNNLKYHAVDMRKEFYNFSYTHEQLLSAAKVIYNRGGDDIHDL